jgi:formylglycine-generating enzyme required for sulfatase activity
MTSKRSFKKSIIGFLVVVFLLTIWISNVEAYKVNKTSQGKEMKWRKPTVTYHVNKFGGPSESISSIQASMQTWTNVNTSDFDFVYGGTTTDSDFGENDKKNIMCFRPMGKTGTFAVNNWWYNTKTGEIGDSDIRFNSSYEYRTDGLYLGYDLQSVATHELGHTLSLGDLYEQSDSEKTMYGYLLRGDTKKRSLHQDDIDGITHLYPAPPCTYEISPIDKSFDSTGGSGVVSVTTRAGCTWSATSNNAWITITSGNSGNGAGTINYTVSPNPDTTARAGTITIADKTFAVNQGGISCSYQISPDTESFDCTGGSGNLNVTASSPCNWNVSSNDSWITITAGKTGVGNGTVSYSIGSHSGSNDRSGTITVAHKAFTVNQSNCAPPEAPVLDVSFSGVIVTLSWNSVPNATGYRLFYAPYPYVGPDSIPSVDIGAQTSISATLWPGAGFYVAVQAYNTFGSSGYSNIEYFIIGSSISVNPKNFQLFVDETKACTISNGVPPYEVKVGNSSVVSAALNDNVLSVTGVSFGSATILVSDSVGDKTTLAVKVDEKLPQTYTNSLGMTFILLPAGTFTMGSPLDELGRDTNETQHQVTLTQPFYMMTTEVTQGQWAAVMGSNPSYFSGCPTCPVETVSWDDVQTYISYMNARGEGTYDLPTEAQWEYAARAGSTTAFYNGGITETGSGYDPNLDAIGWYTYNSGSKTHPVAQKTPNAWGLYDMSGNVWEWCQGWHDSYGSGAATDPTGSTSASYRIFRGGGWYYNANYCRSANRNDGSPDYGSYSIGFRLAVKPPSSPLIVNPSTLNLKPKETGSCSVSGSTPPYSAVSNNADVAVAEVSGSTVVLRGVATGTTTIFVSDSYGNSANITVTVSGAYTNSLGMTFIQIPAGTFTMGSPSDEPGRDGDETQHQVTISEPFYIQTTEVTQTQWEAVMGGNPSEFIGCPNCPVEWVYWDDTQEFISLMNARGEGTYGLPTEAQWEYAARAGSTTAFANGGITYYMDMDKCRADANLIEMGWYCNNSSAHSHPVAQKPPNAWGLYDMFGNLDEWCHDWYGTYPTSAVTDPKGASSGSHRILRGGTWTSYAHGCRSASRNTIDPGDWYSRVGFRLVVKP